jgi:hypothetical protein
MSENQKNPTAAASSADEQARQKRNVRKLVLLIGLLLLTVAGLNLFAARAYWRHGNFVEYFNSKAFEGLIIALLIPLLLSLIEKIFKIGDKIEADQEKRRQEQAEVQRRLEDARRQRQTETIKKTNEMWSELYGLSTEVAYFQAGQGKATVRDHRKKIERLASAAEEMLNLWYLHFPKVALEVQEHALPGLNLLLLSALTVADIVEDSQEAEAEIKAMQNHLLVIQDGIRFGLHYPLIQIFHFAMEDNTFELKKCLNGLQGYGALFKGLLKDQRPNLPDDPATRTANQKRDLYLADYRQKCAQPKAALMELTKKITAADSSEEKDQIMNSPQSNQALEAYFKAVQATEPSQTDYARALALCPPGLLSLSRKRIFSNQQIKDFTTELFFQSDLIRMQSVI